MGYLIMGLILIIVTSTLFILKMRKTKSTSNKEVSKDKPSKIKLDTAVQGFDEVKRFDRDKYLEETFNQVFHAIQIGDWSTPIFNHGSFEFKKDKIVLKVEYSDYNKFKIKSITLSSGYSTFNYRSDLDESVYRYFYNTYAEYIKFENEELKKRADKSLSEIHKALGKDTIRDSKIDQLLNG